MDGGDRRMKVVVVGLGFIGAQRARAATVARSTKLAGVVDHDWTHAKAIASNLKVPAFRSLDEALERVDGFRGVVIATPPGEHLDAIKRSLSAGAHVLCEKPITIEAGDARGVALLADQKRLKLATGFNHRFYPPVQDALKLIGEWAIGRTESVRVEIGHRASHEFLTGWHVDPSLSGGGTLMDNGPHACDLIRRFLGEVVAAQGYVQDAVGLPIGVESDAFALFRNHDRAIAELHSSWTRDDTYLRIDVRGSQGRLRLEADPCRLSGTLADGRHINKRYLPDRLIEKAFRVRYGCERSLVAELEAFAKAPHAFPRPEGTGWDGCRAIEMIQAVYESARIGGEVELEPPLVHTPSVARRRARERARNQAIDPVAVPAGE